MVTYPLTDFSVLMASLPDCGGRLLFQAANFFLRIARRQIADILDLVATGSQLFAALDES